MLKLTYTVHQSIGTVYEYLTDMQKFASVHPVITRIDHIDGNRYLIHETLKFGFMPFSFTYPATVDQTIPGREVLMTATIMKLTTIDINYALYAAADNLTHVSETIVFKSFLPTEVLMGKVFRKQHETLFRNIEALI